MPSIKFDCPSVVQVNDNYPGGEVKVDRHIEVYFDGSCPLCSAEIAYYRSKDIEQKLKLLDVSDETVLLPNDLRRDVALARFHIRDQEGRLMSGARAFVALWQNTPNLKWLAFLAQLPGLCSILELGYRLSLYLRPVMVWIYRAIKGGRPTHKESR